VSDTTGVVRSSAGDDARGSSLEATFDLLERVRAQCLEHPSATAIEAERCRVSYAELDSHAESVATMLRRTLGASGAVLAVLVSDRVVLVPAMLGVLRAGCVFVPLNEDAPSDWLRRIAGRLRPTAFLTTDSGLALARRLAGGLDYDCAVLRVPALVSSPSRESSPRADAQSPASMSVLSSQMPSYVYFTSGSTGEPKGIAGRLTSLGRRIAWEIEAFDIRAGCRVSQLISPTFDPWFRDIFVPLCSGGTIHIPADRPARMNPETLLEWLRDFRINLVHCGPALLSALVSTPPRIRKLPELELMLLAGEFLHVSLVKRWQRRFGRRTRLVNLYGATEATMVQFCHVVRRADLERDFIPIGRPLPGQDVRLVDEEGKPCAPGQIGEIWIGGSGLSMGYFRDDEATRQRFVEAESGVGRKTTLYRTGDLAMELDDGTFRLLGRRDDQLKIRGVRIEPREIEDALTGYPLVAACAVKAVERVTGDTVLVAYIVSETQYPPAVPDMRAYLRERLPPHMIPGKFKLLERLPLTETGKIDRGALPEPDWTHSDVDGPTVGPRNPLEKALAGYWSDILGVIRPSIHDDFLNLGGHSLSAMRLAARVGEHTQVHLSVKDIFDHPTISALAELVEARVAAQKGGQPLRAAGLVQTVMDEAQDLPGVPGSAGKAGVPAIVMDEFGCPTAPSPLFGVRRCNLVLVLGEHAERESIERLARLVEEFDPSIETALVVDEPRWRMDLPARPTLVFSPALVRNQPQIPGRICCGYPLSKSEEYAALTKIGIPVPRWIALREGETPDLEGFGDYVVRKPDYGAKGAEVRIVRRDRVRWKRVVTSAAGSSPTLLVQQFVYTGLWPVSYRINTLFGRVLYAMRITGNCDRPALRGPADFDARGSGNSVSIVANARDSQAELCDDAEIIQLGERATQAFPDLPMLGVDILKEAGTGRLFVTEVNALGYNWNFTREFREDFRLDVESQFDGVRKAAYLLAEQTQKLATLSRPPVGYLHDAEVARRI